MAIRNISLRTFREYLRYKKLSLIKTEGGHEKWWKEGMLRPVILQSHIDPVPEFIVKNNLTAIGSNKKELEEWLGRAKDKKPK